MTWIQVLDEALVAPNGATSTQAGYQKGLKEPGRYTCPLYKTSLRKGTLATTGLSELDQVKERKLGHSTNFVCYFHLPSDEVLFTLHLMNPT